MADKTAIQWTDATWPERTVMPRNDASGVRYYTRIRTDRPGQKERRQMAAEGYRWCRGCRAWLAAGEVTRVGACRPCVNAEYRAFYERRPEAIRARVHARKRAIAPIPPDAVLVAELFDYSCAYCGGGSFDGWDHVIPVALGGRTEPGNVVPACATCNSSKKATPLEEWLIEHPPMNPYLIEYLAGVA